jgi:hypothetical protein
MATLMHYIAETYGQAAFLPLLRALPGAGSLDAWLQAGLDLDPRALEAGWRAWLREQLQRRS